MLATSCLRNHSVIASSYPLTDRANLHFESQISCLQFPAIRIQKKFIDVITIHACTAGSTVVPLRAGYTLPLITFGPKNLADRTTLVISLSLVTPAIALLAECHSSQAINP